MKEMYSNTCLDVWWRHIAKAKYILGSFIINILLKAKYQLLLN